MKARLQNGLLLVNVTVILFIVIVTLFPSNILRIILGLPISLFFPGYALVAALFPRRGDPDSTERVGLGFGLSVLVVTVIGLILNYTPLGIELYPLLVCLAIFIFAASPIAWYRWRRLAEGERFTISPGLSLPTWAKQEKGLPNSIF